MKIKDLLKENIERSPDFIKVMEIFLPFVMKKLDLEKLPKIKIQLRLKVEKHPAFGIFVSEEQTIYLAI